jgi:hypothetical protein
LGNFGFKTLVAIFGTKNSFLVCIVLHTLSSIVMVSTNQFMITAFTVLIVSANNQLVNNVLKITLIDLFEDQYINYLPICYSGYAFGPLILPFVFTYFINPNNRKPDIEYFENGTSTLYFGKEIVDNFILFLEIHTIIYFVLLILCLYPMKNSTKIQNKLAPIFQQTVQGNFAKATEMIRENRRTIEIQVNTSEPFRIEPLQENGSIIFNYDRRASFVTSYNPISRYLSFKNAADSKKMTEPNFTDLPKIMTQNEEDDINKVKQDSPFFIKKSKSLNDRLLMIELNRVELRNKKNELFEERKSSIATINDEFSSLDYIFRKDFVKYFMICLVKAVAIRWFISNFKVLGLFFFEDDRLVSIIGSLSYVSYIVESFTFGSVYSQLQMTGSYILVIGPIALGYFLYGLNLQSLGFYTLLSMIVRVI